MGRTDQPLRREVRPHGGAQTSRGHWREAFGRNSCLDGTSVLCRNVSRMLRHRDAVSDREGLRPPERRDGSVSRGVSASRETEQPVPGGRLPRFGLEWHCHFGANPERARLRSSFLGVLRVQVSSTAGPNREDVLLTLCVVFDYFARSRKLETVRENEAAIRLARTRRSWHCSFHAEGQPDATPKGNLRRSGVKPGQGPATDSTDGTTARWAGVKAPPHQPRLTVRRKVVSFGS